MRTARFLPFLALLSFTPLPASAQTYDNAQAMQRMDRLEHDLQLLQRQLATGAPSSSGGSVSAPPGQAASLEVRLSGIEDEMRNLRGQLEESQNQNRKLSENFEKFKRDAEFRFNELAKAPPPATGAPATLNAPANPAILPPPGAPNGSTTAGDGMLHPPETINVNDTDSGGEPKTEFPTPRDHYNYAFRLLNQTQYPEATASFEAFIKKYPKDPLIGNAYYWEGETFYIRRDYVNAADNFRQGFEALPEGPKAADNLFKLALSLDALNRDKEACVVLQQVISKFKKIRRRHRPEGRPRTKADRV